MHTAEIAAVIFAVAVVGAIGFQLALALGAPWGAYAMGGKFPGRFPPPLRVAAGVQAIVLGLMGGVVLAHAGLALASWAQPSRWLVWIVVAFSAVSLVLNTITPSAAERRIWAPFALVMLLASLVVALAAA
jgi:hypothetical protein